MSSKKISQLPAASSLNNTSLIPVVNNGVTEKAAISQLPTEITTINNLGGGNELGSISGTQLSLKTIVPGTGITISTTTNTLTINNTATVSSVGSGVSIVSAFTAPDLSLKSLTASNGIALTNNGTSIDIRSTVDVSKDSIYGLIEQPQLKEYKLISYVAKAFVINNVYLQSKTGSCTVQLILKDNLDASITSSAVITVNTTNSATFLNIACPLQSQLILQILSTSNSTDLAFTVNMTYS
jgi:hypothetical protein